MAITNFVVSGRIQSDLIVLCSFFAHDLESLWYQAVVTWHTSGDGVSEMDDHIAGLSHLVHQRIVFHDAVFRNSKVDVWRTTNDTQTLATHLFTNGDMLLCRMLSALDKN